MFLSAGHIPQQTDNLLHSISAAAEQAAEIANKRRRRRKKKKAFDLNPADSICCDSYVLTSDSGSHFSSLDPSLLSPPLFLFPLCASLLLLCPPSSSSSLSPPRRSPLLAPEQNEPPLLSGTLFLWQCEPSKQVSRIL